MEVKMGVKMEVKMGVKMGVLALQATKGRAKMEDKRYAQDVSFWRKSLSSTFTSTSKASLLPLLLQ
jgi:hypothetical protein